MITKTIEATLTEEQWKNVDRILNLPQVMVGSMAGMLLVAGVKFLDKCYYDGADIDELGKYLAKMTKFDDRKGGD